MDDNNLAGFLRMAGGQDQQQPGQQDFNDALAKLMTPDPNIEAMMGPQRRQPTLAETLGKQAQAYGQMPDGPMGVDPQGQTPVYNPGGGHNQQLGGPRFGGGKVLPPGEVLDNKTVPGVDMWLKPPMPAPTRGFR